jgi:formylglycine-generating enzyme required for sulfatase activity
MRIHFMPKKVNIDNVVVAGALFLVLFLNSFSFAGGFKPREIAPSQNPAGSNNLSAPLNLTVDVNSPAQDSTRNLVKPSRQTSASSAKPKRQIVARKVNKSPKKSPGLSPNNPVTSKDAKQPVSKAVESPDKGEMNKPCQLQPGTGPEMVLIADGQFQMGSPENEPNRTSDESPQHPVKLAKPFAISRCEVTVGEFKRFVEATGYQTQAESSGKGCYVWDAAAKQWELKSGTSWRNPGLDQADTHPVVCISWIDANNFIQWLNDSLKLTQKSYRLPTEAEWEYAARAGTQDAFYWGQQSQCDFANGTDKSLKNSPNADPSFTYADCEDGYSQTAPVASFKPNGWGVYDMAGNAWEWVADCYHDNYQGAPKDGSAWQADKGDCAKRSVRGGGWYDLPWYLRSAYRIWFTPDDSLINQGFRLARTL